MTATTADFAVLGAGIIGLATALRLQALHPAARVLVIEKEDAPARHQTGRNSGVIHAGVYYAPGSLKARFCREGVAATRAFCAEHGIATQTCGKLIVAADEGELPRMATLEARARQNGIEIERLTADESRRLEPNITTAGALLSPSTGIVDYGAVAQKMADLFAARGGRLMTGARVTGGADGAAVRIETTAGPVEAGRAVVCAGLHADRMARLFGADSDFRVVPFRGEYYRIVNQPPDLVSRLIYPVPDPARPFLGVHLTKKLSGGFTVGPNAVLALAREGYDRPAFDLRDAADSLLWPGFWRLVARNARAALDEGAASLSRRLYLRKVQRYCPRVQLADLAPWRPGIRAQAVAPDGRLIDDFLFARGRNTLHVCNAPSPAATSAIPIAAHVADEVLSL
jgi:L-2-hydroxyglutarate oxidase